MKVGPLSKQSLEKFLPEVGEDDVYFDPEEKTWLPEILTRRDLYYALAEAAELEQSLCCMYLFAAFSLCRFREEMECVPEDVVQKVHEWTASLLSIAREEMMHMGLVWNLQVVLGASPHLHRPNFPIGSRAFGLLPALELRPFSVETLKRFARFERPEAHELQDLWKSGLSRYGKTINDDPKMPEQEGSWAWVTRLLQALLGQLCLETYSPFGEVWLVQTDNTLSLLSTWHPKHHPTQPERIPHFEALSRYVESIADNPQKLQHSLAWDLLQSWGKSEFVPILRRKQFHPPVFEKKLDEAGLNTGAAFGFKALNSSQRLVFVLYYRTVLEQKEDNSSGASSDPITNKTLEDREKLALVEGLLSPFRWIDLAAKVRNPLHEWMESIFPQRLLPDKSLSPMRPVPGELKYRTIGRLYRQIRQGIIELYDKLGQDEGLLLLRPQAVTTQDTNPSYLARVQMVIPSVRKFDEVLSSLFKVIEGGEGEFFSAPKTDQDGWLNNNGHYLRLLEILKEADKFELELLVRPVVPNPLTRKPHNVQRRIGDGSQFPMTLLEHPAALLAAQTFNAVYEVMLRMLQRLFCHQGIFDAKPEPDCPFYEEGAKEAKLLARMVFSPLMSGLLRPLGELLTLLPISLDAPSSVLSAGPNFELYRDVHLLEHKRTAWTFFTERFDEIHQSLVDLRGLLEWDRVHGQLFHLSEVIYELQLRRVEDMIKDSGLIAKKLGEMRDTMPKEKKL
ncbi:MAG: hypothetical protein EP343_22310 [Deltaproteobacteria bacterium]|nr:MAG: hypothetical protein EP343_22310 [Deltaproteobacteria bacterium]